MLDASITVVIPVTHSLAELAGCIRSLEQVDYPPERFQVAIVDCGVLDGLATYYELNLEQSTVKTRFLALPDRPGDHAAWLTEARLNEARNCAMREMPADHFVFTEDDCTFEPDWLRKYAIALGDNAGIAGGPDLLPGGLGWFATSLDRVLTSRVGAGGVRRGDAGRATDYYPRKQNMAVSSSLVDRIGPFDESKPVSGEIDLALRARAAGLHVVYLPGNPVWHRRINSLGGFCRLSAYTAAENVRLLHARRQLWKSAYSKVLFAVATILALAVFAGFFDVARPIVVGVAIIYFSLVALTAIIAGWQERNSRVAAGVFMLTVAHHCSIALGAIAGVLSTGR